MNISRREGYFISVISLKNWGYFWLRTVRTRIEKFSNRLCGGCQVTLSETEVDKRGQQCLFFPSNHNNEALCLGRAGTFYANNPVCATSKNSPTMDDGHGLFKKSSQIARLTHVSFIFLKTLPLLRQLLVNHINHIINWKPVYKNNFKFVSKMQNDKNERLLLCRCCILAPF